MPKRNPVKKKTPPTEKTKKPTNDKKLPQMAIVHREHLLGMLQNATDTQLRELYQQIMGIKWKHGVAELGHHVREIMTRRKHGTTDDTKTIA